MICPHVILPHYLFSERDAFRNVFRNKRKKSVPEHTVPEQGCSGTREGGAFRNIIVRERYGAERSCSGTCSIDNTTSVYASPQKVSDDESNFRLVGRDDRDTN